MKLMGVDLSLTSPALCVFHGDDVFDLAHCAFHFLTDRDKFLFCHKQLHGELFPEYQIESERYNNIATWVVDIAKSQEITHVFIEDYSFASKGRVFAIAENGGVLKYLLWKNELPYQCIPPTVIKKFATGKGNAKKENMQDSFVAETGFSPRASLDQTDKQWNPSSDIIDAFYIAKYGHNVLKSSTK